MSMNEIQMQCRNCEHIGPCDTCKIHARPMDVWDPGPCPNYVLGKECDFADANSSQARVNAGRKPLYAKTLRMAECHPDREHDGHGLCKVCNARRRKAAREANSDVAI
jgi:hypothetical protein